MSRFGFWTVLVGAFLFAVPGLAVAQHPTAVTSIVNSSADTTLEVNHNGSLLMPGTYNPTSPNDSIPADGGGTRLMWYPAKAVFRAGLFSDSGWNATNIGRYSVALGRDTEASERANTAMGNGATASGFQAATAMGYQTTASGDSGATAMGDGTVASNSAATAMGQGTTASGTDAMAMGEETTASGPQATAMGSKTIASGRRATAMGYLTEAASFQSLSIGQCNSSNRTGDLTRLVVGNGSFSSGSCDSRSDALRLKRNGDLAVGHSSPVSRLHAKDNVSGSAANPGAHVGFIENTGGAGSDGLAIQAGPNVDPGNPVNYLTFYDGDGDAIGTIEGDGSGGITQTSGSGDFAEELPVVEGTEAPAPAEIVGVKGGTVSLSTDGANRVMIASRAPILTGNATPATQADDDRRVAVAFIGQVPVRLRGTAQPGDLIVPSGKEDGTARAIPPEKYHRSRHGPIAGQAWSGKSTEGVGEVTVAVGLGRSGAVAEQMKDQRERIAELEAKNEEFEERLAALEASQSAPVAAGLGSWGFALLLGIGGVVSGLLWRRKA